MRHLAVTLEFELRALWNDKPSLFGMLTEPLAYLFLLTAGLSGTLSMCSSDWNYMSFVYPGIIALQGLRAFMHSLYRLTIDRRWGLQAMKIAAGTSRPAYLAGHAIIPVSLCVIQILLTLPCAYILGAHSSISNCSLLAFVGMLSALFWMMTACVLTFYIKKYSQRDLLIRFLLLPLSFAAPVFYSLEQAPYYLQVISLCNPLTYQVQAMREAFLFGHFSGSFYVLLIMLVFACGTALFTLSKAEFVPSETH